MRLCSLLFCGLLRFRLPKQPTNGGLNVCLHKPLELGVRLRVVRANVVVHQPAEDERDNDHDDGYVNLGVERGNLVSEATKAVEDGTVDVANLRLCDALLDKEA